MSRGAPDSPATFSCLYLLGGWLKRTACQAPGDNL
jgi:hypothetical protein